MRSSQHNRHVGTVRSQQRGTGTVLVLYVWSALAPTVTGKQTTKGHSAHQTSRRMLLATFPQALSDHTHAVQVVRMSNGRFGCRRGTHTFFMCAYQTASSNPEDLLQPKTPSVCERVGYNQKEEATLTDEQPPTPRDDRQPPAASFSTLPCSPRECVSEKPAHGSPVSPTLCQEGEQAEMYPWRCASGFRHLKRRIGRCTLFKCCPVPPLQVTRVVHCVSAFQSSFQVV